MAKDYDNNNKATLWIGGKSGQYFDGNTRTPFLKGRANVDGVEKNVTLWLNTSIDSISDEELAADIRACALELIELMSEANELDETNAPLLRGVFDENNGGGSRKSSGGRQSSRRSSRRSSRSEGEAGEPPANDDW